MLSFICTMFPPVLSVAIMNHQKNLDVKMFICYYAIYNLVINSLMLIILKMVFNVVEIVFTIVFALKYLLLATVLSIFIHCAIRFIKNNVKIKFKS